MVRGVLYLYSETYLKFIIILRLGRCNSSGSSGNGAESIIARTAIESRFLSSELLRIAGFLIFPFEKMVNDTSKSLSCSPSGSFHLEKTRLRTYPIYSDKTLDTSDSDSVSGTKTPPV